MIKESLVMESNYNGIVRQIVKDITEVFKMDRTGSFNLPEDLRESELYYDYPQFKKEFEVSVNFEQSDDVDTFEVDGDLYYNDDTIEILIITNPNSGNEILNELVNELNEVVRHELEHVIQYDNGMRRKKEPLDSEKYYSQNHELEAQRAGFKRRARREKNDMETLVRNWFKKYPHKHTLTPEQQERVIQKILLDK
jgi:predicted SprT family Zn-dependent metalloprotease